MSKVCFITKKRPIKGGSVTYRGISKKSGGIGLQRVKNTKRLFKPNIQRKRITLPSGQVKRVWISTKALKAMNH